MPNTTVSLARQFPWQSVFRVLQLPEPADTERMFCPFCRMASKLLFDDRILGGNWFYCSSCDFAGDPIEFASRVWKVDVPAAIQRLQDGGAGLIMAITDDDVSRYQRDHVDARARTLQFWGDCRERLMCDEPWSLSTQQKSVYGFSMPDSFMARGCRTIGLASACELEDFFHPGSVAPRERLNRTNRTSVRRGGGAGGARLFRGWQPAEVWVVPFEDLPGRICGFWLMARNADESMAAPIYRPVRLGANNRRIREAGFAMLSNAFRSATNPMYDTIIVVPDVAYALRLQFSWLRDPGPPLPLVAMYHDERSQPIGVWEALRGKKLIIWNSAKDAYGFELARRQRVAVNITTPMDERPFADPFVRERGLYLRLTEQSDSWQDALTKYLPRLSRDEGTAFLTIMRLPWFEVRELMRNARSDFLSWLHQFSYSEVLIPATTIKGKRIVERLDGWFVEDSGEQICNARIKLGELIPSRSVQGHYRGAVFFSAGAKVPFVIVAAMDKPVPAAEGKPPTPSKSNRRRSA